MNGWCGSLEWGEERSCGPGERSPCPTWAPKGLLAWHVSEAPRRTVLYPSVHWPAYAATPGRSSEQTRASASPASRGLMAWRGAHLGKGACQPHLLAGWGLLPVFLPGQAGRSPVTGSWAVQSDTVRAEGRGSKVSSGSDSGRENGDFLGSIGKVATAASVSTPSQLSGSWWGPFRKPVWPTASDFN